MNSTLCCCGTGYSARTSPPKLFVYGTLKRGQWNHDRFCRNAIDIRPTTIVGRLYQLPAGFPAVVIPMDGVNVAGVRRRPCGVRTTGLVGPVMCVAPGRFLLGR